MDRLKPYVEHCEGCMAAFLRGFFDSDGCVNKQGHITITNSDLNLLTYVEELLKRFDIEATGPRLQHPRGRIFHDPRSGKRYVTKKDCYHIRIRARSNANFYRYIGITIQRKRQRLENYIKMKNKTPALSPKPAMLPTSR